MRLRNHSYDLLHLAEGSLVVDVGCGTGRAAAEMTRRGVRAVGVDLNEQMVTVGKRRWPGVDLRVGDANALPLPDACAAGYRAEKMYHDLLDPAAALREAWRVLAPGGRIVLAGHDWDTFVIDSDDPGLTRTIVAARADTIPSPRAARSYRNLLLEAGFTDPVVQVHTGVFTDTTMLATLSGIAQAACAAGAITGPQAEGWTAEQTRRAQAGRLLLAVPVFLVAARRP